MQIERTLGKYQLVPLRFMQAAAAANQTAQPLAVMEVEGAGLGCTGYTMPFEGQIIGLSVDLSAAGTVGSLAAVPTIDGVACTDPAVTLTTGAQGSDTCQRASNLFAQNAVIGAQLTTTANWNGAASDLAVVVWVTLAIEGV